MAEKTNRTTKEQEKMAMKARYYHRKLFFKTGGRIDKEMKMCYEPENTIWHNIKAMAKELENIAIYNGIKKATWKEIKEWDSNCITATI